MDLCVLLSTGSVGVPRLTLVDSLIRKLRSCNLAAPSFYPTTAGVTSTPAGAHLGFLHEATSSTPGNRRKRHVIVIKYRCTLLSTQHYIWSIWTTCDVGRGMPHACGIARRYVKDFGDSHRLEFKCDCRF